MRSAIKPINLHVFYMIEKGKFYNQLFVILVKLINSNTKRS